MDIAEGDDTVANSIESTKKSKKRKLIDRIDEPSRKKHKHASPTASQITASATHDSPIKNKKKKKKRVTSQSLPEQGSSPPSSLGLVNVPTESSAVYAHAQQKEHTLGHGLGNSAKDYGEHRDSELPSPFKIARLSLYVPVYAIALATATQSLLSTHLAPLLLTYYAPARGVVLAFSDPSISAKPPQAQSHTLHVSSEDDVSSRGQPALAGDESGVSWIWLTVTVLLFRPERNMEMEGHLNICSEGFIGLSLYNYFQCGIARTRIPSTWRWSGVAEEQTLRTRRVGRKGKIKDRDDHMHSHDSVDAMDPEDAEAGEMVEDSGNEMGYFTDTAGNTVSGEVRFRVIDTDTMPAHGSDKWSLQIEGTLLSPDDEEDVLAEERGMFDRIQNRTSLRRSESEASKRHGEALMSGGLGL